MSRLIIVAGIIVLAFGALVFVLVSGPGIRSVEAGIETALDRPVEFTGVRRAWPAGLDADRIALAGTGAFSRADILVADGLSVRLRPLALLTGTLEASSVVIGDLLVRVHHHQGAITHPLSTPESEDSPLASWTDHVRTLRIENGTVEFYDHDAPLYFAGDELQTRFEARLRELSVDVRTEASGDVQYDATGQLDLGPSQPAGRLAFTATTYADTGETDAELQIDGVALPAFNPYLAGSMTGLDSGRMTLRANTRAVDRVWTTNARVDLTELAIRPAAPGGPPTRGPNPSSLLALFADPSGASSLDVEFTWDRDNPNVTFQQALGNGVQAAVQAKMVTNLPNLLGGLLGALAEGGSRDGGDPPARGGSPLEELLGGLRSGGR